MPLWPLVYIQLCVWMCVGIFLQLNFNCRARWEARERMFNPQVVLQHLPPLGRCAGLWRPSQHRFSPGGGREPRALLATQLSSPSYWEELPCLQHGQFRVKERFGDLKKKVDLSLKNKVSVTVRKNKVSVAVRKNKVSVTVRKRGHSFITSLSPEDFFSSVKISETA